jgi:hypothetical protein
MAYLEVIARAKVRPGQLEGVKAQAAEIVRVTREQDTSTSTPEESPSTRSSKASKPRRRSTKRA